MTSDKSITFSTNSTLATCDVIQLKVSGRSHRNATTRQQWDMPPKEERGGHGESGYKDGRKLNKKLALSVINARKQ